VKVWDAASGQEILPFKGHVGETPAVAFHPDGRRVVSAGADRTLRVWDATSGEQLLLLKGHTVPLWSLGYSPDGRYIVSGAGNGHNPRDHPVGELKVWDAQTGQELFALGDPAFVVWGVAYSPDGQRIVVSSVSGELKVWDVQTRQELLSFSGHTDTAYSVAYSPDGQRIVSASKDQTVKVWNAHSGQNLLTLKGHAGAVNRAVYSPDGLRIISGGDDCTVKVWNAVSGLELLSIKGHTLTVVAVASSPDGRTLISGSSDSTVKVWSALSGQEMLPLAGHTDRIARVGYSPDGRRLVAADEHGVVCAWNALTGQPLEPCTDPTPPDQQNALSRDGERVARIVDGRLFVQPPQLRSSDPFTERVEDPAHTHAWHREMIEEAVRNRDDFAVAFHLPDLFTSHFAQHFARPDDFGWWRLPPRPSVSLTQLAQAHDSLTRRLQHQPANEILLGARGWCRNLLGDCEGAVADLRQALTRRPDQPVFPALLAAVALEHGRTAEADRVRQELARLSPAGVIAWHRHAKARYVEEKIWAAAHWHLSQLLIKPPADAEELWFRRGIAALEMDRPAAEALPDFIAAAQADPTSKNLGWLARTRLLTDDRAGYRRACAEIVRLFGATADWEVANDAAWSCALAPDAVNDPASVAQLGKVAGEPGYSDTLNTLAAVLVRTGKPREAIVILERALAERPRDRNDDSTLMDQLLLALAHAKLGEWDEARRWYDMAVTQMEGRPLALIGGAAGGPLAALGSLPIGAEKPRLYLPERLDARLFRQEVEEALKK
jgi:WD40 repeat protein/tetratricopeptide (TPR) repeat protein